ncbi:MAG: hypothetical protein ACLGHQ_06520, partial [Acidimicrobiia bacterium]
DLDDRRPADVPPDAAIVGLGAAPVDPAAADTTTEVPVAGDELDEPTSTDWVDFLEARGLPEVDPLSVPKRLPRLPIEPVDRFELVWPSGEVDDEFGAVDSVAGNGHDPDADRIGATARLGRAPSDAAPPESSATPPEQSDDHDAGDDQHDRATDDVVLAVRRAVASIDVGSLAARQRLADRNEQLVQGAVGDDPVAAPGRVAVRSGRNDWSRRTVARSVFDEPVVAAPADEPERPSDHSGEHRDRRAGALRRLIASLRR